MKAHNAAASATRRHTQRGAGVEANPHDRGILALLMVGFLVIGGLFGFGWQMDRQLRGGLLRQRAEAAGRADWVPLRSLPAFVPEAFIAAVDPSFGSHSVLDTSMEQPSFASELVRQVHELRGVGGRAKELFMTPLLEQQLPRQQLLELYLNRIDLGEESGGPIFGVGHAAQEYFAKQPSQLTLSEAATLAGLLLPPRVQAPATRPGAVGIRRNEVLQQMLADRLITPADYQTALAEPLGFQPGAVQVPMTRPLDWASAPPLLRLPEALQPRPDSAAADSIR